MSPYVQIKFESQMNCLILGVCPIFCSLHSITNGISVIQFKIAGWQKHEPMGFFKENFSESTVFWPKFSEITEIVMLFQYYSEITGIFY